MVGVKRTSVGARKIAKGGIITVDNQQSEGAGCSMAWLSA